MLELLAGAAVAVAALALILEPLTRPAQRLRAEDAVDDPFAPLDESESPKVQALLALKEIEFDRATGKLSDADYEALRSRYAAQAMAAIHDEEAVPVAAPDVSIEDAAEALIREVRERGRVCPTCGPRPEADAAFCSECGKALHPA